jgi:hypothetical protein
MATTPLYTCTVSVAGGAEQTITSASTALSVPISSANNLSIKINSTSPGTMTVTSYSGTTQLVTYSPYPSGAIIQTSISTAKTVTYKVTQAASGSYSATSSVLVITLASATAPSFTANSNSGTSSIPAIPGNKVQMAVTPTSSGSITYYLDGPTGSLINATTGEVTLGNSPGTYKVTITQAAAGSYSALYQIAAGSFATVPIPSIVAAPTQSASYSAGLKITVSPQFQNSTGAVTFSLDGSSTTAGNTVANDLTNSQKAVVTVAAAGTINVYATQASSTGWASVSSTLVGTVVISAISPIGSAKNLSQAWASGLIVDCSVTSANTAKPIVYALSGNYPAGTSVSNTSPNAGKVTVGNYLGPLIVTVSQEALGNYLAVPAGTIACNLTVTPALPVITPQTGSISYGSTYTPTPTSTSSGSFSYSLGICPTGTTIDSASGVVTPGGLGTIQILVTQRAAGTYGELTVPTEAVRLNVNAGTPTLTGTGNRTFAWNGLTASMAVGSNSKGALHYSLGSTPTPPAGTSIDANTGAITPGNTGTISVYVTQDADTNYAAISTPQLVGNLTITSGFPIITQAPLTTIAYAPGEQIQVVAGSTNTATPLVYSILSGSNGTCDSNGNVTITGSGTISVGVTQAASGNFNAITSPVIAGVIVVNPSSISVGQRFVSPTYLGINRLYVLPEDSITVQPSRLACLTRKYACPKPYADAARAILVVGSIPYTKDGSSSVMAWPNMWLFQKPQESTDGVITTFTCQYYGVKEFGDFNKIYQTIGSEVKSLQGEAAFVASVGGAGSFIPFTAKYLSPLITQTYVQKSKDSLNYTTPALPYSSTNLFEIMVTNTDGTQSPLNAITSGLSKYGILSIINKSYPLFASLISIDQTNYGYVTETTLKFGAILSTNNF